MSSRPPDDQTAAPIPPDAWFQIFWRIAASLLTFILILLIIRMCKYFRCIKNTPASSLRRDPNMYLSNQQAVHIWGNSPGVIVSGPKADNVYRTADKVGEFGSAQPVIPEVEEAKIDRIVHPLSPQQPSDITVAMRLSESNTDEDIMEALPYVDDTRKYPEAIV